MNSFYFWDEMAAKCLKSEHFQEAIQSYKHALESTENNADQASVWANIGNIYLTIQNIPAAVDAFLTAARLDPTSYDFDCILERITTNGYLDETAMILAKDRFALECVKSGSDGEAGIDQSPVNVSVAEDSDKAASVADEDVTKSVTDSLAERVDAVIPAVISASVSVEPTLEETSQSETDATSSEVSTEAEVTESVSNSEMLEMVMGIAAPEPVTEETNPEPQVVIETPEAEATSTAEILPIAVDVAGVEVACAPGLTEAYIEIPVDDVLESPLHLRASMQSEELVESVRQHGILQPLVVARMDDGKYVVVTGNRRLAAARLAGLEYVPAVVRAANEREFLELALIENLQRVNLDPLELAEAYHLLIENFGMSLETIAASTGISCSVVTAAVNLLKLTEEGKQALQERSISEGHARVLVEIDLPALQNNALVYVLENRLGVRQTEDLVRIILNAVAVSRSYDESYHKEALPEPLQQESEPVECADEAALETPEIEEVAETELPSPERDTSVDMLIGSEIAETVADVPDADTAPEPVETISVMDNEANVDAVSADEQPIALDITDDVVMDLLVAECEKAEALVENSPAAKDGEPVSDAELEDEAINFYWIRPEAEAENQPQHAGIDLPASAEFSVDETLKKADTSVAIPAASAFMAANGDETRDTAVQTEVAVADSVLLPALESELHETEENLDEVIEEIVQFTSEGDAPLGESQTDASAGQLPVTPEPVAQLDMPEAAGEVEPEGVETRTQLKGLEAITVYRRVVENNPANVRIWHLLGNLYSDMGQYEEAIDCLKRTVELDPGKYNYFYHLGLTLAIARRYPEAIQALEKTIELAPQHILAHCSLAGCYRRVGNETDAQMHIEIAKPKLMQEKAYNRACFESISGNSDRAIELLQIALDTDKTPLEWLRRDPDLDFIRDDPRFQAMVAELNTPA